MCFLSEALLSGTGNTHLQCQAVVSRSLVLAAVVLTVIHVNVVQLQEAHEISGRLQRKDTQEMLHNNDTNVN